MGIYSVFITNKAGQLIYKYDFTSSQNPRRQFKDNVFLALASTFHTLHSMSKQLSPFPGDDSGIQTIMGDTFKLRSFAAPTGIKFFVTADTNQQGLDELLKQIYDVYCDYVSKNPFVSTEMSLMKMEEFTKQVEKKIKAMK